MLRRYAGAVEVPPVRASVTVAAPVEKAWRVYTEGYGSWYPKGHFLGDGPAETVIIEPYEGGRWYEKQADGSDPEWGRVLAWEPPGRLLLAWAVGGDWKPDPDPAHWSEVEVLFSEVPGGTRVDLEHRYLGRHGDGARSILAGVSDPDQGHPFYLRLYVAAAEGRTQD
ncbi:MAG TPA: SRPBCC family protein [Mycobacteriales bacterium]|nr:SRPBCC family protein [Mycobacteriales bacterium]